MSIASSDARMSLTNTTMKFQPEFVQNLRLYTVNINKVKPGAERDQNPITSAEKRMAIDKFTDKILKSNDHIIQVNHRTFLSTGPKEVPTPGYDVKLTSHHGDDKPINSWDYKRVAVGGGKGEKLAKRWVKAELVMSERVQRWMAPEHGYTVSEDEMEVADDQEQQEGEDVMKDVDEEIGVGKLSLEDKVMGDSRAAATANDGEDSAMLDAQSDDLDQQAVDGAYGQASNPTRVSLSWTKEDVVGRALLVRLLQNPGNENPWAAHCIQAILTYEARKSDASIFVHGNRFFGARANTHIQDVELRFGYQKTLTLSPEDEVMVRQKPCHELFFPSMSLVAFIEKHCGPSAIETTVANKDRLTNLFRGLLVKIRGRPLNGETRAIEGFSPVTAAQQMVSCQDEQLTLSQVYAREGIELTHPSLPCVNVGSAKNPTFVAAELCFILPSQLFKPGKTFKNSPCPTFQRELEEALKIFVPAHNDGQTKTVYAAQAENSTDTTVDVHFHRPARLNWPTSDVEPAKIIIVEIGNDVSEQQSWNKFLTAMVEFASTPRDETGTPIAEVRKDSVRLHFSTSSDLQQVWTRELLPVITQVSNDPSQVAVAFAIPDIDEQKDVYTAMKDVCESLGVQSFGVNLATLASKAESQKTGELGKYCGRIHRKMLARNPEPFKCLRVPQRQAVGDIAIAVHVTELLPTLNNQRHKPLFMATAVSRQMTFDHLYRSIVGVIDTGLGDRTEDVITRMISQILGDIDGGNPSDNRKVSGGRSPKRVFFLRSGVDLPSNRMESDRLTAAGKLALDDNRMSSVPTTLVEEEHASAVVAAARSHCAKHVHNQHLHDEARNARLAKAVYAVKDATLLDETQHEGVVLMGSKSYDTAIKFTMFKDGVEPEGAKVKKVMPAEKDLARLFHDSHIGLYESKWPVPTYLARRLTQWAIGKIQPAMKSKEDGGPLVKDFRPLPMERQGVQRDLWYL